MHQILMLAGLFTFLDLPVVPRRWGMKIAGLCHGVAMEVVGNCWKIVSDHNGTPDKSGPMALNQLRPSVPVWSETLWQTFVKHVAISA